MAANHTNRSNDTGARPTARSAAFPLLSLLVAVLIAGVLQFAAAAKVSHGADVLRRMKDAALLLEDGRSTDYNPSYESWLVKPDATFHGGIPIDFPIAAAEFLLVVLVLAGHGRRAVWLLVPIVFASFFGYALRRTLNGLPCGCFGDLWHPPDGVSMALDAGFVVLALGILGVRRASTMALIAIGVLALAGLAGGYLYAGARPDEAAPASDPTMSPAERLLASDLMKDVREAQAAGEPTAYYVFIWDPTCSTCERFKPIIEQAREDYDSEDNPFLKVLLFKKQDLRDELGIQTYEWESSPSVFVVRDAAVIDLPGGEELLLPDEVLAKLTRDEPLGEGDQQSVTSHQ